MTGRRIKVDIEKALVANGLALTCFSNRQDALMIPAFPGVAGRASRQKDGSKEFQVIDGVVVSPSEQAR